MNSVSSTFPEAEIVKLAMEITGKFEGCALKEYICPAGKPTIGHGRVIEHGQYPNGITQQQADEFFAEDMTRFVRKVIQNAAGTPTTVNELAALSSFAYNVGIEALLSSTLWRCFKACAKGEAARQFPRWDHGGGKELKGLLRRRLCEQHIFTGGSIGDLEKNHWFADEVK